MKALIVFAVLCFSTPAFAQNIHAMACVQKELNHLGFQAGPVDGLIGTRTRNASDAYIAWMKTTAGSQWNMPRLTAGNAQHWCEKVAEAHPELLVYWREYQRM